MVSIAVWMFLIQLLSPVHTCSCIWDDYKKPLDQQICLDKYNLVIRALVLPSNVETTTVAFNGDLQTYNIKTIKVYKNTKNVPDPSTVTTGSNEALCGQFLQEGKEYLLIPWESGLIGHCDPNKAWENVPANIIQGLENGTLCNMTSAVTYGRTDVTYGRTNNDESNLSQTSDPPPHKNAQTFGTSSSQKNHRCALLLLSCCFVLSNM